MQTGRYRAAVSSIWLAGLILIIAGCATHAPAPQEDVRADRAARQWLAVVDRGEYERSWQQASAMFRNGIDQGAWIEAVGNARADTGAPSKRKLVSIAYTRKLPGVRDNDYVVLVYASRFDDRPPIQETVTLVREDGELKTAGYFLR